MTASVGLPGSKIPLQEAPLPLGVTLSIGQVKFHLSPSLSTLAANRISSVHSRGSYPPSTNQHGVRQHQMRARVLKRRARKVRPLNERGGLPCIVKDQDCSPPILTIRRAAGPPATAQSKSYPRRHVHDYILRRLKSARGNSDPRATESQYHQNAEKQTEGKTCSKNLLSGMPEFLIDLHSFTGTLAVSSTAKSEPNNSGNGEGLDSEHTDSSLIGQDECPLTDGTENIEKQQIGKDTKIASSAVPKSAGGNSNVQISEMEHAPDLIALPETVEPLRPEREEHEVHDIAENDVRDESNPAKPSTESAVSLVPVSSSLRIKSGLEDVLAQYSSSKTISTDPGEVDGSKTSNSLRKYSQIAPMQQSILKYDFSDENLPPTQKTSYIPNTYFNYGGDTDTDALLIPINAGHNGIDDSWPYQRSRKQLNFGPSLNMEENQPSIRFSDAAIEGNLLDGSPKVHYPTELHHACATGDVPQIWQSLKSQGRNALFETDDFGRLPIHILTENEWLISNSPVECENVVLEMIKLMGPDKMVHALHPGTTWAPFVYVIANWVEQLHHLDMPSPENNSGALPISHEEKSPSSSGPFCFSSRSNGSRQNQMFKVAFAPLTNMTNRITTSRALPTERQKFLFIPTVVTVSDHVCWAIHMLSYLIDEYPERTRDAVLTNIATVPLFLKSIFLITNTKTFMPLLEKPLVKHVIVDKRSINVWLIAMLTSKREIKLRAVMFLKCLSEITLTDLAATSSSPDRYSDKEIERFVKLREETFNSIHDMPGFVPVILELGNRVIESLSITRVMRYSTDRSIKRGKVFFFLICDFFFDIFLLAGYRMEMEVILINSSYLGEEVYETDALTTMTTAIACYFLVKDTLTIIALARTSRRVIMRQYLTNVFNLIDIFAVVMLLVTRSALKYDFDFMHRGGYLAAITSILLWLKFLGAFKILNSSFALFFYAVIEVIKEIKWVLLFLVAITVMFGDAVRSVMAVTGVCYDPDRADEIQEDFCAENLRKVHVRMYAVLVGEVNVEDFEVPAALLLIFTFFTFFCIIVLLNILVAIIIDSYETSKERSQELFGRARIEYAAHLLAREQFVSPKKTPSFHTAKNIPRVLRRMFKFVFNVFSVLAILTVEYGFISVVLTVSLDGNGHYNEVESLSVIFISVGIIFNAYLFAVVGASLLRMCEMNAHQSSIKGMLTTCIKGLERMIGLFHSLMGFNSDEVLDVSADLQRI